MNNQNQLKHLKELYSESVVPQMVKTFGYENLHQVPKILKIVINMGVGEVTESSKAIDGAVSDLALISGQKPVCTVAKKSIATFKLRKGMKIGTKVTLRKERMYDFLERMVFVALPRVKNFRGFSAKKFDGMGNFNFGVSEQIIFPEIDYDKVDKIRGMNITIVTSASTVAEGKALLSGLYLPFLD